MSIKAIVVSILAALTFFIGAFAIYSSVSTFGPVAAGTGDATGTGIAASSVSWTLAITSAIATAVTFFKKWQPLAQTVLNATTTTTNTTVTPLPIPTIPGTVTDGFSAISAIVAWKANPTDKNLERSALMAILTLADDLVGAKYPAAQDNLNALGHTVIEALFPTSIQPASPSPVIDTSMIDAIVTAALAKLAAAPVAPMAAV